MGCSNSKAAATAAGSATTGKAAAGTPNFNFTHENNNNHHHHPNNEISNHGMQFTSPTTLPPRSINNNNNNYLNNSCHTNKNYLDKSSHKKTLTTRPSAVGLDQMIESRREEGNLTNNVVHIEVPFGKPIEEVYSGVHDGPVLGSGVSGIVRLVTHKESGAQYAVKCLDIGLISSEEQLGQLREEIFIMCQLDHPNIVRLEEVYESHSEIYLVQELCLGGELFDRLDEQPDYHYNEVECARLVKQILCSVRYCHSKGIVHRDLKLENFLFSSKDPKTSQLKMIDFGLSKHFFQGEVQTDAVGTPYTVAPEIIKGNYNEKCDVWAIGVIAFLLLSGEPPFGGCGGPEPMMEVRANILGGDYRFEPVEIWDTVSELGKDFIRTVLVTDPVARPNACEAQEHNWIQHYSTQTQPTTPSQLLAEQQLHTNVINSLVQFKEYSDMRKLLCEVLSFTLLPEQIVHLRTAFTKYDIDGSGEISLEGLKTVLMEHANAGSLGALTEEEVMEIFDAMRVRKSETKINWHEFIAAGLSQCKVDDRNLRLAFNRLDREHKGFITFDNVLDLMGTKNEVEEEEIRRMYQESLTSCRRGHDERIYYEDFLLLMKGQQRDEAGNIYGASPMLGKSTNMNANMGTLPELKLSPLREEEDGGMQTPEISLRKNCLDEGEEGWGYNNSVEQQNQLVEASIVLDKDQAHPQRLENVRVHSEPSADGRLRSLSFDDSNHHTHHPVSGSVTNSGKQSPRSPRIAAIDVALALPERNQAIKRDSLPIRSSTEAEQQQTIMVTNRELYRAHRKMRLAVLEASKRFEEETARRILQELKKDHVHAQQGQDDQNNGNNINHSEQPAGRKSGARGKDDAKPGLIMRRGTRTDKHLSKELSSESVRKLLLQREQEHRKNLSDACKRGGRRGRRQKVVSDLSSMMSASTSSDNTRNNTNSSIQTMNMRANGAKNIGLNSNSFGRNSVGNNTTKPTSLYGSGSNSNGNHLVGNQPPVTNTLYPFPSSSLTNIFEKPPQPVHGAGTAPDDKSSAGMLSCSSSDGNLVGMSG